MATSFRSKSVLWVMFDTVSTALLSTVAMLIVARFITPSAFGAASIVVGLVLLVNLYAEGLFHDALIQNRDLADEAFEQAFCLVLMIAFVAVALTAIGACIIPDRDGHHFGSLAVLASTSLLFSGPLGVANARQRRLLAFEQVARASVFGKLVACAVSIPMAWMGFEAVSLVMQYLAGCIVQTFLLYFSIGWIPRLRFSFSALTPILRFALPYAFMHTIVAARTQGFALLVASLMGLSAAGFVNVAFRLAMTPFYALATTFTNLCFPLLAQHQASKADLREAFVLVTKVITVSTIPLFVGLALVADDLVPLVLGPNWDGSIVLLKILALSGALLFSRVSNSLALRALGHVRYSFWNASFQLIVTLGGLLIVRPQEAIYAVGLWVLPLAVQLPITWFITHRVAAFGMAVQLRGLVPSLLGSLVMTCAVLTLQSMTVMWPPAARLVACVTLGGLTYGAVLMAVDRQIRAYARDLLFQVLSKTPASPT